MSKYTSSYVNNLKAAHASDKKAKDTAKNAKDAAKAAAVTAASKNNIGGVSQSPTSIQRSYYNARPTPPASFAELLAYNLNKSLKPGATILDGVTNLDTAQLSYAQRAYQDFIARLKAATNPMSMIDNLNQSLIPGNTLVPPGSNPRIDDTGGSDGEGTRQGTTGGAYIVPPKTDYLPDPNDGGGGDYGLGGGGQQQEIYYPFYGGSGGSYNYTDDVSRWYQYMTQWNIGRK